MSKENGMQDYSGLINMMETLAGDKSKVANRSDKLFNDLYDNSVKVVCARKYESLLVALGKKEEWFCKGAEFSRVKILDVYDYNERKKLYNEAQKQAKEYLSYSKEFLPDGKGSDIDTMYNEEALLELLSLITELVIAFQQEYTNRGGKGTPDTPRFIQGLIGMICCLMLDVATSISISVDGVPRERFNTQAFVMKYMHLLSIKKGHEIFKKEGKILQDKWGLSIQSLFTETNFYAPSVPFNYAGHKDGILGFIVRRMIKGIEYKKYYDVFGGSGRALLQIPLEEDKEYYINDFYPPNYILWFCLKDDDLYNEFIIKLNAVQKVFLDKHAEFMKYINDNKIDKEILNKKLDTVQDATIHKYHEWLHDKYDDYYSEYGKYIDDKGNVISLKDIAEDDYVNIAVAFVVVHNFLLNGRPADALSRGSNLFKIVKSGILKWNFERDFKGMRKVYKNSNVTIQNDRDINLIKEIPNESDVVLQIDTPYISTKGYKAGDYTLDNLKEFMDNLFADDNKRKFIFHCQSVFNVSAGQNKKQANVFIEFLEYMRDNGKNNYITFYVNTKNVHDEELSYEKYRDSLIDKYYNMVVDGKDDKKLKKRYKYKELEYFLFADNIEKDEETQNDKKGEVLEDSREIIFTNFYVGNINEAYNYQGVHNPYSVNRDKKKAGEYKVITMDAYEFFYNMVILLRNRLDI